MPYNIISNYPGKIDELLFFQDISIDQLTAVTDYNNFIKENAYNKAIERLQGEYGLHSYCANLFNLIVHRIKALQNYLVNEKEEKNNPILSSDTEPEFIPENLIWIEEE